MKPSERLAELGLTLPQVAAPVGSYVPATRCGNLVLTSGQLPFRDGKVVWTGKVPGDVSLAQAAEGASIAMLNALAAAAGAAGGVDRIARVVRVCVYVNSSPGFFEQPKVANGASDLLVRVFGDAGRHARSAVGAAELPLNAAVELELVVEVTG
ncbi:MAG: RidA family protein [Planctomycetes bacterium]|nr:RidA family protein [Planctomycetota bacterium]